MAIRINTPTAVPDMFGAGKDGFNEDPEGSPPSTQLSALFFNHIQEEIVGCIEDQGGTTDPGNYYQLSETLNSWNFSGSPKIKDGASLTVEGNGNLFIDSAGLLQVLDGGGVVLANGSTLAIESDVTFVWSNNTLVIGEDEDNVVTIHGDVTLGTDNTNTVTIQSPVNFGANTMTGAGGTITTSTINVSSLAPTVINFPSTSQSSTDGRLVYDGRRLSIGDGTNARRVYHPKTAYVVSDGTSSATDDVSGASVSMIIGDNVWVYVRVHAIQECDASGKDVKLLVAATNGVDNVAILNSGDADQAQVVLPTVVAANDRSPNGFTVRWKPTNDAVTPNNTSWTLYVRHGVSGGANLVSSNVKLEIWYE